MGDLEQEAEEDEVDPYEDEDGEAWWARYMDPRTPYDPVDLVGEIPTAIIRKVPLFSVWIAPLVQLDVTTVRRKVGAWHGYGIVKRIFENEWPIRVGQAPRALLGSLNAAAARKSPPLVRWIADVAGLEPEVALERLEEARRGACVGAAVPEIAEETARTRAVPPPIRGRDRGTQVAPAQEPEACAPLRVLSEPAAVHAAFEAACDWCDVMCFATPAAVSNLGKWPVWAALERNATKITAAFVALDGLRSEPAALEWLQSQDCLRFVPAADGSFRANVYRFQKDDQVRVLLGAGMLGPAGLMAPLDAMIAWEGPALDRFTASVDAVLQKAKEKAHVPTGDELAEYSRVFYEGAELWDQLVELGAPFIRSTARDDDMPELELIVDEKAIRKAMKSLREELVSVAGPSRQQKIGYHGGSGTFPIHWCAALKMWALLGKAENRYWNCFGVARPDPEKALQITVQVNPPFAGIDRKTGGAFARDPVTGDVYLVHRGRIGGAKGVGAELFWKLFRGGVLMKELEPDEKARVVVVGKLGSPTFARDVAGFVHEVGRIKAAAP